MAPVPFAFFTYLVSIASSALLLLICTKTIVDDYSSVPTPVLCVVGWPLFVPQEQFVGVDLSKVMVEVARERYPDATFIQVQRVAIP